MTLIGQFVKGSYLAALINGDGAEDAVMAGHKLSGWCGMRQGAISGRRLKRRK